MNHTDDDQPLGEAPIIEMSMAELADRIDVQADRSQRQAVALNKIAELHAEYVAVVPSVCDECDHVYPCKTVRIINEAGL